MGRHKGEKNKPIIYALYKGDKYITEGTREEICKELNIKPNTFYYYRSKFWAKRCEKGNNHRVIIKLDKMDE